MMKNLLKISGNSLIEPDDGSAISFPFFSLNTATSAGHTKAGRYSVITHSN